MAKYYDGTKLLSLSDINGNKPEIYMCTSNRSAGKTTYFNRLCVNRYIDSAEKFAVLYRFRYELDDIADKFFKDIGPLFFPDKIMRSEPKAGGIYHQLYLQDKTDDSKKGGMPCGYAMCLNSADQIKKYSHLFSDVKRIVFDEFQSETNHYCNNEVKKFISIHTSLARGHYKQSRYVPVYMLSNPVTILNPYYVHLGISERLMGNTKFLRGDGFVLEQGHNEGASKAQKTSAFNRAFSKDEYIAYSAESVYLNDQLAFVNKMVGKSRYLCTLKYENTEFAIREFPEEGVLYCDTRVDSSFKDRIAVTTDDHNINYVMLNYNKLFLQQLRYYFDKGCFRFKDLRCKEAVLKALSY